MRNYLNELEQVEQELGELRSHLERSLGVLDDLARIQAQFEDLAQTYQKFKQNVTETQIALGDVAQNQEAFNHRFAELEAVTESRWGEVRSELTQVQNELGGGDRSLRVEFTQQVSDLKGEIENRLTAVLQEWGTQKAGLLEDLAQTHQRLKEYVEEAKATPGKATQNQEALDHRFMELERVTESQWGEIRSDLMQIQNELGNGDRTLRTEFARQISDSKGEIEQRLASVLQEWVTQREAILNSLEEVDARSRAEARTVTSRLNESGFNGKHVERLDKLETYTRASKGSLRDAEKQLGIMRNWLIFSVLAAILALLFPISLFITDPSSVPFLNRGTQGVEE